MPIEISWYLGSKPLVGADDTKRTFEGRGPFKIGRSANNDITLDHPEVSRSHAEITIGGTTVQVSDRGSQNGTQLDGKPITTATWGPGQELRIGPFGLRYRLTEAESAVKPRDSGRAPRPTPAASPAAPVRQSVQAAFPGIMFDSRVVSVGQLKATGKVSGETTYAAIGGGVGSFCWVDHLRIFGVPSQDIRVLGVALNKRPYAKYSRLCRNSQIPDHERLRSNSISTPDNIWGFPGYASREMIHDLLRGRLAGLRHVLQVFGEAAITESYTPRSIDVFRSLDVEAQRIGWEDMWLHGQVVALRKTDDGRYVIAYRVPSQAAPDVSPDRRERFLIARYVHIATGYGASNFLPDLQQFRHAHPDTTKVVNAYEEHDDVYRALEERGGTVLIRGRGIVASRIIQRIWEARAKNKNVRLLHLVRAPIEKGSQYGHARRSVRNDVEQQPFNWPKACWGGSLRQLLEDSSPEERARLMGIWGGTSTADRDDWNNIIDQGKRDGWYKIFYGAVASISEKDGRLVTRLSATEKYQENLDLPADYIIDCTGVIARIDETPLLADLLKTYELGRNRAPGSVGDDKRLAGLAVTNSFEIAGLQNGAGRVWAAGIVTAGGPYAAVDSFLGLQFAALRSVDQLAAQKAPSVSKFGPLKSSRQWIRWCVGAKP